MNHTYKPWLHRLAVLTACVALLPIVVGAVVTTMKAGMAFADWPTSDGHNMLLYPWLHSTGNKFIEHGHRLAGIVVGLCSIGLAAALWRKEPRRWMRVLGGLVLLGVILQGVLGGARVLGNSRTLAMLHGQFGAWMFTLMACVALFTGRSWLDAERVSGRNRIRFLKPLVLGTVALIGVQFFLGGMLRHFKMVLFEHVGFAFVVLAVVLLTTVFAFWTGIGWVRRPALLLVGLVLMQALLGAASWVTTFGFPPTGYVAVQDSLPQVIFATVHTVLAMLVLATSVVLGLRVFRVAPQQPTRRYFGQFSEPLAIRGGVR